MACDGNCENCAQDQGEINSYEELVAFVKSLKADGQQTFKKIGVNKAAARRLRKGMLAVRDLAKRIRAEAQELINESD